MVGTPPPGLLPSGRVHAEEESGGVHQAEEDVVLQLQHEQHQKDEHRPPLPPPAEKNCQLSDIPAICARLGIKADDSLLLKFNNKGTNFLKTRKFDPTRPMTKDYLKFLLKTYEIGNKTGNGFFLPLMKKLREMNFVNPTAEDYTLVFTQGYVRHVQVERVYPNLIQWPGGSKFAKHPGTVKAIDRNMVKVLWNMASGYEAERILRVGKKLKTMELEKNAQYYVDQQKFQLLHHRADGYYLDFRKCARPAIAAVVAVAADGGAEIAGGGAGAGGEPAAAKGAGAAEGGMGNEQKAGARQQEPQQQAQEQPPEAANAAAPKAAGGAPGQQGEGIGRKKVYFADSEAEFLRVMEEVGMGPKDSFLPQLLLQSDSVRDCYKNSAASQQRFLSDFKISVQICRLYDDYTKRKHQQGRPQQLPKEGEILANRFFDEGASGEFDDDFFTSWEDDLAKQKKVRFKDQADADAQQEEDEGAARGDVGGGGEARGAAFRGRSWRTRKPHHYASEWDRDYFDDEDEDSAAEDEALLNLPLSEDDDPWHDDPVAQVEMGEDLFRYALHLKQKASVRSRARAQVDGEGKVIQHFGDERDDDVDADQVSGNEFGRFREEVAKDFLREEDEEQIMLPVADYGRKKWICDRMTKMGQDADPLICHEVFQCFIPHSFLLYCPHDVSNEGGRPSWRHYVRQEAAPRSEFTLPVQTDRALWLRNRVWSWGLVYRGTRNDLDGVDAFNEAGAGVAAAAGNFRDGALSSDAEGRGGGLNAAGITQESLSTQLLSMLEFGGGSRNPESRAGSKGRSGRLSGRPLGANLRPGHELRAARGQMRAMGWSSEQSQGQNELGPGAKLRSFIGETDFEPHVMAWRVAQAWTYPSPGTVGLYLDRFEARDDLVLFCQGWETYLGAMEWNYTNVGLIGLLFILAEVVLTLGAIFALRCWLRAKAPKKAKRRASAIKGAYVYSGGRFSSLAMGRGTNDNDLSAADYASGMTEALQRTSEMRERQSQMQQRQSQKMDACTNNYGKPLEPKRAENENLCADAILGRESTCARASIGTMRSSLLARISAGVPADRDENAPASQHEAGVELASEGAGSANILHDDRGTAPEHQPAGTGDVPRSSRTGINSVILIHLSRMTRPCKE
eukprot:g4434.t1